MIMLNVCFTYTVNNVNLGSCIDEELDRRCAAIDCCNVKRSALKLKQSLPAGIKRHSIVFSHNFTSYQ